MSHLLYAGGEASRLRDCELVPCTPKLLQGALPHHITCQQGHLLTNESRQNQQTEDRGEEQE